MQLEKSNSRPRRSKRIARLGKDLRPGIYCEVAKREKKNNKNNVTENHDNGTNSPYKSEGQPQGSIPLIRKESKTPIFLKRAHRELRVLNASIAEEKASKSKSKKEEKLLLLLKQEIELETLNENHQQIFVSLRSLP